MIRRDPVGVVASIAPWNYPLMMMAWKLGPAIGGGNTVVFKVASDTALSGTLLMNVFRDAGLPDGVVNLLTGAGGTVGQRLVEQPGPGRGQQWLPRGMRTRGGRRRTRHHDRAMR